MDAPEAKAKRTIKLPKMKSFGKLRRRSVIYILAVVLLIAVVAICVLAYRQTKPGRSQQLLNQIASFKKDNAPCKESLKKLGTASRQLGDTTFYNDAASEAGLNYLLSCDIVLQDQNSYFNNAARLSKLYGREGKKAQQQQLIQIVDYLKKFEP